MKCFVYRRKRNANADPTKEGRKRSVLDKYYRGRFRLPDDVCDTDIPLHTTDKQIAQQKLAEAVRERQNELAGNPTARLTSDAKKPLSEHLEDFLRYQESRKTAPRYVLQQKAQLKRLFAACEWQTLRDITSESFEAWAAKQKKISPVTINNYQHTLSAFLREMGMQKRINSNPARLIRKRDTRGGPTYQRGALALADFSKLVASAGKRSAVYLTAGMTGLRSNELKQIEVRDIHLDASSPFIKARSNTTKNGKEAIVPLHADVVSALRPLVKNCKKPTDRVFEGLVPRCPHFYSDLKTAGISQVSPDGKVLHFHSLRHTFGTLLALAGVSPRVAMELMRHSDMRLTTKIYTDAGLLPLADSVKSLPSVLNSTPESDKTGTPIGTPAAVFSGPSVSTPVPCEEKSGVSGNPSAEGNGAASVPISPSVSGMEKWYAVQGSNLMGFPVKSRLPAWGGHK